MSAAGASDVIPTLPEHRAKLAEKREDARRWIAFSLIGVYVVMLLANIGVPVMLYVTSHPTSPLTLADTKDLTLAISAVLGNIVGVLGVVVGFYFKSLDDDKKAAR